ncbi:MULTISPECIES: hypothetical protein [unclassified Abiotrophia]|uniref:hypothetical protein n=1 Tax=unclassified Abiotrophia TaxID=2608917 RepID=UPI0008A19376|nr:MULTISPECIES: hypothetical protein [unclassified Abiotrophia]MBF0941044.1 hypothetical protein [Abiotrophia sp.]OFS28713.1 hypothetical protein HMPREF3093_06965 [Abiotrophia sp. HMSC24B09]
MTEEVKQNHQPGFEKYMKIYTALRLITLVTGIYMLKLPVIWLVYLGRLLAFYWLMTGWKTNDGRRFNYGFILDTILSVLELSVWVVGLLVAWPYVILALSYAPMFLIFITPIIVWTVLFIAKLRFGSD